VDGLARQLLPRRRRPPRSVGEILDELREYDETTWLRLTRRGDSLEVRGLLHEEQHAEFETPLCAAFRGAARFGGEGEVVVCDTEMIDFARRVQVRGGESSVSELDEARCKELRPRLRQAILEAHDDEI
jgi:hypothetical protein